MAASHPRIVLTPSEAEVFALLRAVVQENGRATQLRVAGGWVRDKLMGKESDDVDIALDDCMGVEFAQLVNKYLEDHKLETHKIGVIAMNPEQSKHLETATMQVLGNWVDLVNLRCEEYAEGSRIPTGVRLGTPLQDARRRDLTFNALFYNLNTGEVEDFTGTGLSDLRDGIVRTPLEPRTTFLDDPLRVLRAVRFAARFSFRLDPSLIQAARDRDVKAALEQKISRERIGQEMDGMFRGEHPELAMALLYELWIADVVFRLPSPLGGALALDFPGNPPSELLVSAVEPTATASLFSDPACPLPPWCLAGLPLLRLAARSPCVPQDKTARKLLFVAALLLPLRNYTCPLTDKKNARTVSAAYWIVLNSVKWCEADAAGVRDVLAGVPLFGPFLAPAAAVSSAAAAAASSPTGPSRLELGLAMRKCGAHWRLALTLAAVVLQAQTGASIDPTALLARILDLGLEEVVSLKPLLNGNELHTALGVPNNAAMGALLSRQVELMLENPGATRDDLLAMLRAHIDASKGK